MPTLSLSEFQHLDNSVLLLLSAPLFLDLLSYGVPLSSLCPFSLCSCQFHKNFVSVESLHVLFSGRAHQILVACRNLNKRFPSILGFKRRYTEEVSNTTERRVLEDKGARDMGACGRGGKIEGITHLKFTKATPFVDRPDIQRG